MREKKIYPYVQFFLIIIIILCRISLSTREYIFFGEKAYREDVDADKHQKLNKLNSTMWFVCVRRIMYQREEKTRQTIILLGLHDTQF